MKTTDPYIIRFKHLAALGGLLHNRFTLISAQSLTDKEGVNHKLNIATAHFGRLWQLKDVADTVELLALCQVSNERVRFTVNFKDIFHPVCQTTTTTQPQQESGPTNS